jgi:hypothetical protein
MRASLDTIHDYQKESRSKILQKLEKPHNHQKYWSKIAKSEMMPLNEILSNEQMKPLRDSLHILSSPEYLEVFSTSPGRRQINRILGDKLAPECASKLDLSRISGVGKGFASTLLRVGIDSVRKLAEETPENVVEAMTKLDPRVQNIPSVEEVAGWISQAKELLPLPELG